ncbi:MAG: ARPP-1 family domain-containing protein [Chloroflexota bacterium]
MEKEGSGSATSAVLAWLEELTVGEGATHGAMTVFPVSGKDDGSAPFDYRTLAEGIAAAEVVVAERPAATVPELVLVNKGKTMVLVLDGEEVVGGRQNRIVNASFLVGAGMEVLLPVSCVEHGRWHDESPSFMAGEASPASLKREKQEQVRASLRATGRHIADQGAIWDHIARREAALGSRSATGAMHDVYQGQEQWLADYERAFPYPNGALGLIVAIGGRMVGGDLFDRPQTARALWAKIVRSYALDALGGGEAAPVARGRALRLLGRLRGARGEAYPSLALGEDVRLEGDGAVAAALVYRDTPVHVGLFRLTGSAARAGEGMASASVRRHLRRTRPVE